jgi:CHAD domain-containing protein
LPSKRKSKRSRKLKQIKVRWDPSRSVTENASEKLPEMARGFFAAGRELVSSEVSFETLHRFRLLTKRFRYTLELFRPCYGPGLPLRIETLRMLQQDLGEINDCATTRDLLLDREDLGPAQRDWLAGNLEMLATARVAKFRKYWQDEFGNAQRERWWTNYLARFAGPRRK